MKAFPAENAAAGEKSVSETEQTLHPSGFPRMRKNRQNGVDVKLQLKRFPGFQRKFRSGKTERRILCGNDLQSAVQMRSFRPDIFQERNSPCAVCRNRRRNAVNDKLQRRI